VTVIGDAILDRWWLGGSRRLSREAPAPIVELESRTEAAGGAANTAMNLCAMGADVRLAAVIGADAAGDRLLELLTSAGVDVTAVVRSDLVRTVTKTRIVADDQVLVRVDEPPVALDAAVRAHLEAALGAAAAAAAEGAAAFVVSEYGAGLLAEACMGLFERMPRPPHVIVDAHDPAAWRWLAPDVVVPNEREASSLIGESLGVGAARVDAAVASADRLLERSGAAAVIVTLDRDGALLLRPGSEPVATHTSPVAEKYASGAGDTFTAALVAALAADAGLEEATRLAQLAADVATRHLGTTVCSADDLESAATSPRHAVFSASALATAVAHDRADGRRIVFTNGCFDVLHFGHTSYLRQARALGDRLIVAVNSDASVRRLKGPSRPVNPEGDRAAIVAALECVDYVTVFEGDTPIPLLEAIRPDVYVKGGDYSPEMLEESGVVHSYGGEVRMVGYVPAHSTTELVDRIRGSEEGVRP
jgi:rfaE bifunctional protein nucleotidyltransferase chain/domain/rfaE bifunctional protein kinase chain/domain